MGRKKDPNSLTSHLEKMIPGEEFFIDNSFGYISVLLDRLHKKYPNREYTKVKLYTHKGARFTSIKDFKPIICIMRFK